MSTLGGFWSQRTAALLASGMPPPNANSDETGEDTSAGNPTASTATNATTAAPNAKGSSSVYGSKGTSSRSRLYAPQRASVVSKSNPDIAASSSSSTSGSVAAKPSTTLAKAEAAEANGSNGSSNNSGSSLSSKESALASNKSDTKIKETSPKSQGNPTPPTDPPTGSAPTTASAAATAAAAAATTSETKAKRSLRSSVRHRLTKSASKLKLGGSDSKSSQSAKDTKDKSQSKPASEDERDTDVEELDSDNDQDDSDDDQDHRSSQMNATANTNTTDSSNQGGHLAPNSNAAAKAGESKHASSLSVQASTASDRHSRAHEASNLRGLRTATTSPLAGRGAGSASLPSLTLAQLKEDQERAVSPLAGGTATRSSKLTSASSPGMSPPAKLQSGASSPMGSMGSMGSMSSLSASQSNLSALGGRTASAQASAEAAAAATANGLRFDRNVLHRALAVDSEAREMLDAEMTQREERARQSAKSGEKLQTLILAEEAVKTFSMQFLHRIRMSNPRDRDVMQATMKKYLFTHTITPGTPCTLRVSSKSVVAEAREPARKSHKETNYGGYSTKEASTANDPDAELPLSISLFSVSTTCISDDDSSLFSLSLTDSKDSSRHSCYVFRADSQLPSDPVGDPASSAATGNSASAIPVALAFASAFRMAYARFKLMATKRDSGTGYTALHWAAKKGQLALCAMWLKAGADPNALSRGGYNPLHLATMHGHNEVMRLLVRSGANPHADSYGGFNSHDLMTVRVVEEKVAIVPPSGTLASGRRGKKQRQTAAATFAAASNTDPETTSLPGDDTRRSISSISSEMRGSISSLKETRGSISSMKEARPSIGSIGSRPSITITDESNADEPQQQQQQQQQQSPGRRSWFGTLRRSPSVSNDGRSSPSPSVASEGDGSVSNLDATSRRLSSSSTDLSSGGERRSSKSKFNTLRRALGGSSSFDEPEQEKVVRTLEIVSSMQSTAKGTISIRAVRRSATVASDDREDGPGERNSLRVSALSGIARSIEFVGEDGVAYARRSLASSYNNLVAASGSSNDLPSLSANTDSFHDSETTA